MNVPQHWRLRGQRLRLEGSVCPVCGWKSFPPRRHCPQCIQSPDIESASLNSFTGFPMNCPATSNGVHGEIALRLKAMAQEVAV